MSAQSESEPAPLMLPKVLDLAAATPLKAALLARRGAPLELDGSEVQRMGGLCLQVLLAAQAAWAADGQPLRLASPSEALRETLANLGAAETLMEGAAA